MISKKIGQNIYGVEFTGEASHGSISNFLGNSAVESCIDFLYSAVEDVQILDLQFGNGADLSASEYCRAVIQFPDSASEDDIAKILSVKG